MQGRELKQLALEVSYSVIQKEFKKQLVCAKGRYKVKGVLVYDLVTLGTIILGRKIRQVVHNFVCKEHSLRYNLLSAREGKLVMFRSSLSQFFVINLHANFCVLSSKS